MEITLQVVYSHVPMRVWVLSHTLSAWETDMWYYVIIWGKIKKNICLSAWPSHRQRYDIQNGFTEKGHQDLFLIYDIVIFFQKLAKLSWHWKHKVVVKYLRMFWQSVMYW